MWNFPELMGKSRNQKFINSVGKRIREIRLKKGITQEDFIFETGINIGRIERGERDISLTTLKLICTYLEVEPIELFK